MEVNNVWYGTKRISDTVWCLSDHGFALMYLIIGKDRALLIDSGFGIGNLPALCGKFTSRNIIHVLTHAHPDHCMGAGQFESVHIAKDDIELLEHFSNHAVREEMAAYFFNDKIDVPCNQEYIDNWVHCRVPNTAEINDGSVFDLGKRKIRVIMTPGHTKGSLCLLDEYEGRLFSGDTVLSCNHLLNLPESTDLQTFHQSLLRLKALESGFNTIYPGHEMSPLDKSKLDELLHGVEGVLSGEIKGIVDTQEEGCPIKYAFGRHNWILGKPETDNI